MFKIKSVSMLAFVGLCVMSACAVDAPDGEAKVELHSDVRISARSLVITVVEDAEEAQTPADPNAVCLRCSANGQCRKILCPKT